MDANIGVKGMFMTFGFVCILFTIIAFKWVPETHGKLYRDAVHDAKTCEEDCCKTMQTLLDKA